MGSAPGDTDHSARRHQFSQRTGRSPRQARFGENPQSTRAATGSHLLRHGHELEDVAVQVFEIDAAAAVPVVELAVV